MGTSGQKSKYHHRSNFAPTQWSLILHAGGQAPGSRDALNSLCKSYWYPLYAHVRRSGLDVDSAQDVTQGFFADILSRNDLATLDRARGRFRSWLLASLDHYLSNERARARTWKRGGKARRLSLAEDELEQRYQLDSRREIPPDKAYDRRWAAALIEQVLSQVSEEAARAGRSRLFDAVKKSLMGEVRPGAFRDLATQMGTSESAVYVAAHRLRHRCRALLYQAVAQTVQSPQDVEDEIRHLFASVG